MCTCALSAWAFVDLSLDIFSEAESGNQGWWHKKRFQLRHDGTGACGDARDGESAGVRAVPCLEVAARAASGDVRAFRREGAALLQVGIRLLVLAGPCM